MAKDDDIPQGRLERFRKMAGMATSVGAGLAADRVKRLFGGQGTGHELAAKRILETLGSLKGAALKAGQMASMFSDQLPPETRVILSKLFSQAPTLPFEKLAPVLEAELGRPLDEVFSELSEEPLAAASLGQVHAAKLRSGEDVVVKVQYPGVAEALDDDLRNLESMLGAIGLSGLVDPGTYAQELRTEIGGELHYLRELSFLQRFRTLYEQWPDIAAPKPYPALCTERVLVLERFRGPTLGAVDVGALDGEARWRVAEQLVRATWGPWIRHRAIHADTHPGNFILLEDGRLGVLDFGCVKLGSEGFHAASLEVLRYTLGGPRPDWVEVMGRAGFVMNLPEDKARTLLTEIVELSRGPVSGVVDFAKDDTLSKLTSLKRTRPLDLVRIKPPAESLLVGRALAGLLQNLKLLQAKGDLRPVFRGLMASV